MSVQRKVGVMVDSGGIQANLTHMTDAIRNANYKVLAEKGMQPNEEGEYIDEEGDNLLMTEEIVKALLQDAIDSYLVATLPGKNKTDPNEFTYYLWDSFPNVAEYIQREPRISGYVSSLFATTCGMMVNSLSPALNDIHAHGQNLEHIETFQQGHNTSYYVLVGEDAEQEESTDPELHVEKMSKAERAERTKIELIRELGVEGYEALQRKNIELRNKEGLPPEVQASLEDHDTFTKYVEAVTNLPIEGALNSKYLRTGGIGRYYTEGPLNNKLDMSAVAEIDFTKTSWTKEEQVQLPATHLVDRKPNEPATFF